MPAHIPPDWWESLADYAANTMSAAERDAFEQHLAQHPHLAAAAARVARGVALSGEVDGVNETDRAAHIATYTAAARERLLARIATDDPASQRRNGMLNGRRGRSNSTTSSTPRWWSDIRNDVGTRRDMMRLAIIAVVLIVGGAVRLALQHRNNTTAHTDVPQAVTYATATGQTKRVSLSDGSTITLAPRSRIGVRVSATRRDVVLDGQGYFDVVGSSAPFIVHAGGITTRVLGTTFDVRHYPRDSAVRVVVLSGKVASSSAHRAAMTLAAGRMAWLTDSTASVTDATDMTPYSAWRDGHLIFRKTPVSEMLDAVGDWYGYRFQLADSTIANDRVTATFDHKTGTDVLTAIKTLLDVSMTFTDTAHVIVLSPRHVTHQPGARTKAWRDSITMPETMEVGR